MKKVISIVTGIGATLAFATPAFAQVNLCPTGDNGFARLCGFNVTDTLPAILTFILIVAIIIALFYLIWGGIKWVMSGGDKGNVETARNQIIAAIIGLIVIFLAWFVINLVLNFFLGTDAGGQLQLPTVDGQG